ncbi:MAG: flagellar biosynthesis protein FlgA [Micromonosporaceae bacterium]|nr:flagellar biosynthesis protein FlgA [Micromonosporaceae bacterium]
MTATANWTTAQGTPPRPAPITAPLARLPRRRRWGLFALGMVLVALGAIVTYLLVVTAGVTRPYLAVAHDVPYGSAIGAGDLTVVNVNPAPGLSPIPASERDQVIGQHAAADLFAGTLLTRAQVTDLTIPAPGEQLVGIELKPGQLPARTLRPGDAVILVIVPPSSLAGVPDSQPSGTSRPSTIPATVEGSAPPQTNGNVRVDVAVSQSDGPTVASMAAAGRVVIVVTTRR